MKTVAIGILVIAVLQLTTGAEEPKSQPASTATNNASFQFKAGTLCKSDDGKLDGVLIQHTPPELKNAKDFADPDSLITAMILMGQVMPEWGIFENKPEGKLLAIGEGLSKGPKGTVFRAVSTGVWPKVYDYVEGALYIVTSNSSTAGSSLIRLQRKQQ